MSAECGRIEEPWRDGVSNVGPLVAASRRARTGRHTQRYDRARIHPDASTQLARRRLLDGGDDVARTAVRAVLHRAGQSPRAPRGMHGQSERPVVDTTGTAGDV